MFSKKTIRDIDIRGKRVLVRVDYSVELTEDGEIIDDYKLRASLPTLRYAVEQDAAVVLISHMGRPEGHFTSKLSLFAVAKRLRELLERDVDFVPECAGERAAKAKRELRPGQIVLLENLRFDTREEANEPDFAHELAADMDVFVQDGFAVAYRRHASTDAITKVLPSVAGLLLEKEVRSLEGVFGDAPGPKLAVISGLSVHDKLPLIERALAGADAIAFGGLLADVFLNAVGVQTGKTRVDASELPLAKELLHRFMEAKRERGLQVYLPYDAVVASRTDAAAPTRIVDWSAHVIADIEAYPKRALHEASQVQEDEIIVDTGPFTGAYLAGVIQHMGTVLFAGTPGDTAVRNVRGPVGPFAHGTEIVFEAMSGQFGRRPEQTIIVGDDAVGFAVRCGVENVFDHVSTGGGASLEVLAGHSLIGVDNLEEA
jgi:phosphoglycerate kinase